jgi:hypothetical protein
MLKHSALYQRGFSRTEKPLRKHAGLQPCFSQAKAGFLDSADGTAEAVP